MNNYQTFDLPPNFCFKLMDSLGRNELSDEVSQEVDRIWQNEKRIRKESLFNGRVLSLIDKDESKATVEFIEYKLFLAYVLHPELRGKLGIKPISLSCLTRTSEVILIGRRSELVLQYPLFFELAPSGGIDAGAQEKERINVKEQALRELVEETGYSENDVEEISCLKLIYDSFTGIYEVIVEIVLFDEVRGGGERLTTDEYKELQWVNFKDIPAFIENNQDRMVPLSLYLLRHFKRV